MKIILKIKIKRCILNQYKIHFEFINYTLCILNGPVKTHPLAGENETYWIKFKKHHKVH